MIQSFADKKTAAVFHGERMKGVSPELAKAASRKLDMLNLATALEQLRVPPGNRLEKLSGDLAGCHSVRVVGLRPAK